jgi:hypothetical protein
MLALVGPHGNSIRVLLFCYSVLHLVGLLLEAAILAWSLDFGHAVFDDVLV